jgi:endonuclease V-like protein UPF0215 family
MNVIGFDDGPFAHDYRGDVLLVGAVCAGTRLDGIVSGRVRRDGVDSTRRMIALLRESQFASSIGAVLLQGIAVAGFNVVDIRALSAALGVPVLVVMRRPPDLASVRRALFSGSPRARPPVLGAARKWELIEGAGPIDSLQPSRRALLRAGATGLETSTPRLWIQRAGLSIDLARTIVETTTRHGQLPEALRIAHLIAGGIVTGKSRGRA